MRLFVAIELDDVLKKALMTVQRRLSRFDADVRWTRLEQMHLTLKFLGEVPDDEVEPVCAAAESVAHQVEPFDLALDACGCFPPRGAVRIVHIGVAEPQGRLQRCRDLCQAVYADLGFEPERRAFSPHLTVGRVRQGRRADRLRQAVETTTCQNLSQPVKTVRVIRSDLKPTGACYTKIAEYALNGSA